MLPFNQEAPAVSGFDLYSIRNLIKQEKYEDAIKAIDVLYSHDFDPLTLHQLAGRCFLKMGQADLATKLFEEALLMSPYNAEISTDLGECYYLQGLHQEARYHYEVAFSASLPDNVHLSNLVRCYENLGMHKQARTAYQEYGF